MHYAAGMDGVVDKVVSEASAIEDANMKIICEEELSSGRLLGVSTQDTVAENMKLTMLFCKKVCEKNSKESISPGNPAEDHTLPVKLEEESCPIQGKILHKFPCPVSGCDKGYTTNHRLKSQ